MPKASNKEEFVEKSFNVHGVNRYDYSKVKYVNNKTKVEIICNKCGKTFWQTPTNHLKGRGCPDCASSKLEKEVKDMLKNNEIEYISECTSKKIIGLKRQRIDIYIPTLKMAIECQGIQHFKEEHIISISHGLKHLKHEITDDSLKYDVCKKNEIEMIYFYPKEFNDDNLKFYSDKNNIHTIEELEKYILDKVNMAAKITD